MSGAICPPRIYMVFGICCKISVNSQYFKTICRLISTWPGKAGRVRLSLCRSVGLLGGRYLQITEKVCNFANCCRPVYVGAVANNNIHIINII